MKSKQSKSDAFVARLHDWPHAQLGQGVQMIELVVDAVIATVEYDRLGLHNFWS